MKDEQPKPESPQLPPSLPVDQDVLWAVSLVEEEEAELLLSEDLTHTASVRPDIPQSFPQKVMQALQNNRIVCALGAKTPKPVLNMLYWGLNRPLVPVLGTAGAVLMCPVCIYSSGLIVIGMLWWGAKTPRPQDPSLSEDGAS